MHLIAGISELHGLEGIVLSDKSINSKTFLSILDKFDKHGRNYTLLGDNATWHKSGECKSEYRRRNKIFIFNVPYSPQLNPIENYFGILKSSYKRFRMQLTDNTVSID